MLAPAPLFGHLPERRRHRGASHALIRDIAARSRQLGDDFSRRWVAETHTHTSCAVFDTADIVRRCRVFSVIATYSVRQRRKRVLTSDPTWPGCWTFCKIKCLATTNSSSSNVHAALEKFSQRKISMSLRSVWYFWKPPCLWHNARQKSKILRKMSNVTKSTVYAIWGQSHCRLGNTIAITSCVSNSVLLSCVFCCIAFKYQNIFTCYNDKCLLRET